MIMPFFHDSTEELRDLNQHEKMLINLTVVGAFFTCFDFVVYYFFYDALQQVFFAEILPESVQYWGVLCLLMLGYIARPFGGMVLANFGDRFGRKSVMIVSLAMVAGSSLLIGLLPTFEQAGMISIVLLMLLRFVQGIGFGAEVPTSWVYLAEHMPRWHIGSVCGRLMAAFILALLLGNMLSALLSSMLTWEQMLTFGWRLPFLLGAVGSLVAIMLRYRLTETPIWLQAKDKQRLSKILPLKCVFKKYQYGLGVSLLLSWVSASIYLSVLVLLPSVAVGYFDVPSNLMEIANGLGIFFAGIGSLTFGYFADRFNYGRVLILGCMGLGVSGVLFFTMLEHSSELLLMNYSVLGFFAGIIGIVPSICVRVFPVAVRLSGVAFCYNVAQALTGSLTMLALFYFTTILSFSLLLYLVFVCVVGAIGGLFLMNLHGLYRMEVRDDME